MEIFSANNILFFIVFFVPGFIAIKIYDLFVPNERRDFSKSLFEAVAYSFFILGVWSYPLKRALDTGFFWWVFYGVILSAIILPIIFIKMRETTFLSKHLVGHVKRPWDWFFMKRVPVFVIVRLSDNTKIGGVFFDRSRASSYPLPEQIYIEEVWSLDEEGRFDKPIEGSKGIIILGNNISTVEFFKDGREENGHTFNA